MTVATTHKLLAEVPSLPVASSLAALVARHVAIGPGVLLALAVVLRLPVVMGGQIDSNDEGVYWESLRAMAAGHQLFAEVYSSQPPGFLLLLFPFFELLGKTLLAARLGVLLIFLAGLLGAYWAASRLGGRTAGLLAMAVLAADPISIQESVALQADAPAVSLALVALALATRARTGGSGSLPAAAGAGALLALGVLVKPLAAAAGPALVLALLPVPLRWQVGLRNLGLVMAGGLVMAAAVLLPFAGHWQQVWDQSVGLHLTARGAQLGGIDAYVAHSELPLVALGTVGLLVSLRRAPQLAAVAGLWGATAALMLAVQRPLWSHHLVALSAALALLTGGLAHVLPAHLRWAVGVTAAAMLLAGSGRALWVAQPRVSDATLRPAAARLDAVTSPTDLVITDDQYLVALAGRNTPPELVDTSMVHELIPHRGRTILSGDLTAADVEVIAQRSDTRAFLFLSDDRLAQLPGLEDWVRTHYPRREQLDAHRVLYLR